MKERETFASRLGFVLISAGCAIGLGNVWRFPYIVGRYGGAAFVLIYLAFLVILGLPIMAMEFSVGRASRQSIATSFHKLEPKGTKWHWYSWFGMAGNYMLMMFYTTVAGWMILYCIKMAKGDFVGADTQAVQDIYSGMLSNPGIMLVFMILVILIGMGVCSLGLQDGVEKITKVMMVMLLAILIVLVVRSVTLENAMAGLEFYLKPNFHNLMYDANGNFILGEAIFAAMGQSFFTLSLGIGAMAIFGSYIGKEHRLMGEAINVGILDTFVAFVVGLVIFPSAFAFGIQPDSGPNLIFITLPNVFNAMPLGRLWGALFFVFMSFAALSTVIAVFQNIITFPMDKWGWSHKKSVLVNMVVIFILSLPCLLGFNLWSGFNPLGDGTVVMDLEDFILSDNLLPLGSLVYLLFCVSKHGWGWDNFLAEADAGEGIRFPARFRPYFRYVLPLLVLIIFVMGYWNKFGAALMKLLGA
ncbi:Sodium:neurotransmitter symporter family protein [Pseudoflavonifractor capillosus ATCC 29799]|uniref:Transporter n=1 Tax=Pseudoflavonifractor capillosus ATCC 29799 TaxID=411467 RepID=A6NPA8_9FIRM|nr:sodium-dependent transporter [Pseudoflavonifractor capillosus]EDN02004.1 Sodium:neurotransmitter symporter family protein [Pseudoflavonifractor capillosus ATCC 29799]